MNKSKTLSKVNVNLTDGRNKKQSFFKHMNRLARLMEIHSDCAIVLFLKILTWIKLKTQYLSL